MNTVNYGDLFVGTVAAGLACVFLVTAALDLTWTRNWVVSRNVELALGKMGSRAFLLVLGAALLVLGAYLIFGPYLSRGIPASVSALHETQNHKPTSRIGVRSHYFNR